MSEIRKGDVALVTGAASGIGLALSKELAARGLRVWMTDIDLGRVTAAAERLGPLATAAYLDVCDAGAFRACVGDVEREAGKLDFLFNNAGVLVSGETHEFVQGDFERIIDVNIRGVVNGTLAAYPNMVKRRCGHIVNTASLAGLAPAPLLAAYGMSKHAVVGLTRSLRFEAERYGVGVSAICPAGVDTPLLDEETAGSDVSGRSTWRPDVRQYLTMLAGRPCSPELVAKAALRGVAKNLPVIVVPARARLTMMVYRLVPGLVEAVGRQVMSLQLRNRKTAC